MENLFNIDFFQLSLIFPGSWMFHNVIPWDDDMDLWLPYDDVPKWKRHFRRKNNRERFDIYPFHQNVKHNEYELKVLQAFPDNASDADFYRREFIQPKNTKETNHKFKFFGLKSPTAGRYLWRYPFIGMFSKTPE